MKSYDVIVIGGGPSGLTAAAELKRQNVERVLLIERQDILGGIPLHCYHRGFGVRHLKKFWTGPRYVTYLSAEAKRLGVECLTGTTVLDINKNEKTVQCVSARGLEKYEAKALLLATGCRESTRSGLLVPGYRGRGIYNTSQLQQWVYQYGARQEMFGKKAVVVGSEDIGLSAILTLNHAHVKVMGLVENQKKLLGHRLFTFLTTIPYRVPFYSGYAIQSIEGSGRVEAVVIGKRDEQGSWVVGKTKTIECDSVVFSGRFVPENELCKSAGVLLDEFTNGPTVDQTLQTETAGVFASGNLLRSVETADVAAIEGRWAASNICRYLKDPLVFRQKKMILTPNRDKNVRWIMPQRLLPGIEEVPKWVGSLRVKNDARAARVQVDLGKNAMWRSGLKFRLRPEHRISLDLNQWPKNSKILKINSTQFQVFVGK